MDTNAFYTKEELKEEHGNNDSRAESILSGIAYWLLIIGFAAALFVFLVSVNDHFIAGGIVRSIVILFSTFLTWSVLKVFINISMTLKEINKKIR